MLKLVNVTKDYTVGNSVVNALKGVTLNFRESEFVSILGPSGCGKTTLLNIIGGLDKYTTGDLVINGVSTKKFKSKDWDSYRNHSIGFVFQNYNLINHLSILKNVELALTLSGVGPKERKARAAEALVSVGLEEQLNKKPNQLSGGQMQRVAIARALVNNPPILLADEPTGALDSKTSVQIMEILKGISKDRLIVMVTHNPELAERYSTRIVKLSDGEIVDDSDPFEPEPEAAPEAEIAADASAEDAGNAEGTADAEPDALAAPASAEAPEPPKDGAECSEQSGEVPEEAETAKTSASDTPETSEIAETEPSPESDAAADRQAEAPVAPESAAAENLTGTAREVTSDALKASGDAASAPDAPDAGDAPNKRGFGLKKRKNRGDKPPKTSMSYLTALSLSLRNLMTKKGRTIITAIAGSIGILGIALVLSISNGFNLYIADMEQAIMTNQPVSIQQTTVDLEEMQNSMMDSMMEEKDRFPSDNKVVVYDNNNLSSISQYTNNLSDSFINYMKNTDESLYRSIDVLRNLSFHVLAKNDDASFTPLDVSANGSMSGIMSMFSGGGKKVTFNQMVNSKEYVLEHYDLLDGEYPTKDTDVVLVLDSFNRISTDVLSALGYKDLEGGVKIDFDEILGARNEIKLLSNAQYFQKTGNLYPKLTASTEAETLQNYYDNPFLKLNIVGIMRVKPNDTSMMLSTGICFQEGIANKIFEEAKDSEVVKAQGNVLSSVIVGGKFVSVITGEELSLSNLSDLTSMNFSAHPLFKTFSNVVPGLSEVSAINIYPVSLDAKEKIVERVDHWNEKNPTNLIKYTDTMAFMFGSFQMILSAITYVLIAFVAISLIVSTVMIGIITYVSVIERTKEIGILRAIGARKKDISRVFNAESTSIGFASGLIGVFVTWVLLFPINLVLEYFTEIPGLAVLSPWHALILMAISMLLTFISGLIPSRIASKKDPILALRSE